MVVIDIPLTVLLIGFGMVFLISIVLWMFYHIRYFMKLIKHILSSVPVLPPDDLEDLEKRAEAIQRYNSGDKDAMKQYWKKFYESSKN